MDIVGWGSSGLTTPSGSAALNWGYNNGTALQSGSPRPGFASGSGSEYGVFTSGGSGSDGIRNAVRFTFSNPVSAFGVFGGDLETGGPGSPLGFLFVTFTNNTTETINYAPDSSLFPNATFSGTGNNTSETYGNETTRFVGISDNTRLISSVVFVVGDDDLNDNGDNEQLSFIAPMTFTRVTATGDCENHVPTAVPEPSALILAALACLTALSRRRREGAPPAAARGKPSFGPESTSPGAPPAAARGLDADALACC